MAGLVALATLGAVPAAAELHFRAAGLGAGLTAERRPLDYSVADMTGGAAVGDFNRDGWQDIFLLGGGGAVDALYLNNGDGTFTDHAAAAGVAWSHRGLAAAVGDFDGDGWQDLFVTSLGGSGGDRRPGAHRLYRNLGVPAPRTQAARAGRTAPLAGAAAAGEVPTPPEHASPARAPAANESPAGGAAAARADRTAPKQAEAAPPPATSASHAGAARAEAAAFGGEPGRLPGGIPRFEDVAVEVGVATTATPRPDGMGAAFGDYDLDGDLDLFVTGYQYHDGNRLFRNDGGRFTDVTVAAFGPALDVDVLDTWGFAPAWVDMDGDRFPELLIAGDYGTSRYFLNDGGLRFRDLTAASGTGAGAMGMGSAFGDFDGDGRFDWYLTSVYARTGTESVRNGNQLYLNEGRHRFREASVAAGVNHGGWGWGAVAADLNHDGVLDLVTTNGWTRANHQGDLEWLSEPTRVYLGRGEPAGVAPGGGESAGEAEAPVPAFDFAQEQVGLRHRDQGRGLLAFDYDNDGDRDILIVNLSGPVSLYRNDLSGPATNYLRVFLDRGHSRAVAPDGIGALVSIRAGDTEQQRFIGGEGVYLGSGELSAHFGVGAAAVIDELAVTWPDGAVTGLQSIPANQTLTVRHGTAR
ncbi:MAG: CRTAC1 family protein [Spirochaetaceae bacterium]|nr:CRTAC1 family protein [Spirochaetaceae bacterium]